MELILDAELINVLSSLTRRKILKELKLKTNTVSSLSRNIGIQKAAIYNHLYILNEQGLVNKKSSTNEFLYYELTEKGIALLNHESIKI